MKQSGKEDPVAAKIELNTQKQRKETKAQLADNFQTTQKHADKSVIFLPTNS